jgi:hypothetical protein
MSMKGRMAESDLSDFPDLFARLIGIKPDFDLPEGLIDLWPISDRSLPDRCGF